MIVKSTKAKLTEIEAPRGGAGLMNCLGYLTDEQLSNNMKGFNFMELKPGGAIGFHQHVEDEEIYFIVEGEGIVRDNDTEDSVKAGDLVYTAKGEHHGIKNTGDTDLKFVAFMVAL